MRKMKGVEMIKLERTADHIEKTLREAFNPQELEVSDVSEAHRGHSGFQEGGESHFEVRITAAHFSGMRISAAKTRVKRLMPWGPIIAAN